MLSSFGVLGFVHIRMVPLDNACMARLKRRSFGQSLVFIILIQIVTSSILMMQATIPCILVVGCADVGKKTLISRITGTSDQQVPILWTIDTKYYTAQAKFVSRECSSDNSQLSRDCESLILVFDAEREETFRAAKQWLADQNINPEISLLVANKSELLRHEGCAVQRQPWHGEAQDWCCEHLYEYIEVTSGDLHFVNALLNWCSALNAHPMQALIASHLSLSLSPSPTSSFICR